MTLARASTIVFGALTLTACTRMPFSSGAAPAPVQAPVVAPAPTPLQPPPAPPPGSFVQTTSDIRATRVIDIRDGMTKAVLFRTATDFLMQKYSIDVSDQRAGFLMTPWQAGSTPQGAPDLRYRTRIIVRFLGEEWKQASVRAEANWQKGEEWDIGFDSKILEDVTTELRARIGKR
ncbi:MAG TPA: hypothetical protein VIP11_01235 [Gemmatimonadaceae bacterium]